MTKKFVWLSDGSVATRFPLIADHRDQVRRGLERLDGRDSFASLLSVDVGVDGSGSGLVASEQDFIQCAGTAAAMTVELSELCDDGFVRRWVLGRTPSEHSRKTTVRWSANGAADVFEHELWTAASATELFVTYYESGAGDLHVNRRLINERPA